MQSSDSINSKLSGAPSFAQRQRAGCRWGSATTLIVVLALPAHPASFNCKLAQTPREKAICSSPELSTLDGKLAHAYIATRSQLTPASAALVQADQRDWLAWLDKVCPAAKPSSELSTCLKEHYGTRVSQLTTGIQRVNGTLFYTRAHFVFVPGKPPTKDDPANDPGFGYGEFAWPQVDAPDPDHTVFNTAVLTAAQKLEGTDPKGKPPTFDNAVDPDGYIYGAFTLSAVNDHLIDIDFINSSYGWGAAHPLTGQASFLWSPTLRRALTAADILRPDSAWQTALAPAVVAKLQQSRGPDGLWNGKELQDSAAGTLKDPTSWDLSSSGLKITFGQYAVTSYAGGMPDITFTWQELAPYLNPTLNPATLPPPHPVK